MAVSFNYIPSNIRVPLFYAEVDNSKANTATAVKKALIIAPMLSDGTAEEGKATFIATASQAKTKFGRGSVAALMVEAFRNQDTSTELWVVPMAEATSATAATGSVSITGPALESGTIAFYVGAQKVAVNIASGTTAAQASASLIQAINANKDLPVTAASGSSDEEGTVVVTITAKNKGVYGNEIPLGKNLQGSVGGEENVKGLNVTVTAMSGGSGSINYATAFAAVETETWYYIAIADADATALDAVKTEMQDATGRWSYARMQYGHVFSAKRGTTEALVTFGGTRNDQHVSVFGIEPYNPNITWVVAGAVTGRAAIFYTNDPARPLQTGQLIGLMAPSVEKRFGFNEQNTLLTHGIATLYQNAGTVMIQRAITTYQTNSFGDADNSYLDSTTLFTLAEIITRLKSAITSKYSRHKLADDGTRFGAGQAIVTPSVIRSELIAKYAELENLGLVENAKLFAKYLIVERNADDPNRLDVLLPPDLVNQLRIFALQAQFRLQYSAQD